MAGDSPRRRSRANRLAFPAAEPEYRAARQRCAEACAVYNGEAEFASPEKRARLWQRIVGEQTEGPASDHAAIQSQLKILPTARKLVGNSQTRSDITDDEATRKAPLADGLSAAEPRSSHSSGDSQASQRSQRDSTSPEARPAVKEEDTPPPSPEFADVQPKAPVIKEPAVEEYAIATPPPSRKSSRSALLVSRLQDADQAASLEEEHDPAVTNPFIVNAPYVKPPVHIDYGTNLIIGAGTFINRNFIVIDSPNAHIRIGKHCLFGPNVTLAAVEHPLDADARRGPIGAPSFASDIEVGDECWIAADVKILCGVRIGSGCVIGAGSVVTKDIPSGCIAYGNPARVRRVISPEYQLSGEDVISSSEASDQASEKSLALESDSDGEAAGHCSKSCHSQHCSMARLRSRSKLELGKDVALILVGIFSLAHWIGYF